MRQSGIGLISERDISKERVRSDMKKNANENKYDGQFKDRYRLSSEKIIKK